MGLCDYGNEFLRFSKAGKYLLAQFPYRINKLDKINIVVLILQLIFKYKIEMAVRLK
jgi:hypothetical protein